MQEFTIKEKEVQFLLNLLGEFPAKNVISGIDLLRSISMKAQENKEVPENLHEKPSKKNNEKK
jgi:hypothetical protein